MTPETREVFWANWRKGVVIGIVLLVLLAAAFSAGRFSAPAVVETREVDRWHTLDLRTEDITRGFTFARTVERVVRRNVITTITVTPDAGTTTTIADTSTEREGTQENTTATEQLHRVEIVEVDRERIVEKIVTLRPSWRVGALVGASLTTPLVPIAGPLVLGVSVEHRIAGGLSAGAWVNTVGAAGGVVSLEF